MTATRPQRIGPAATPHEATPGSRWHRRLSLAGYWRGTPIGPKMCPGLVDAKRPGPDPGILDWYTILVGVLALLALVMHGALWVQMKTTGAVNQRSAMFAANAWWGVLILTAMVTTITFKIQSQVKENFVTWPWGLIFPFLAIAGIVGVRFELVKRDERKAFFASCAYLMGMLTSVVFGLYPLVLPARNPVYSLTISSAKAADYGLKIGLVWWTFGILLVTGYFTYIYRSLAGKVAVAEHKAHSSPEIA